MVENTESQPGDATAFDPRIQTEDIAFKPDEMQPCGACKRLNPPTRLRCLYCGAEVEVKPENAVLIKPASRKLEPWERGFNVILREPITDEQANFTKIASFLSTEPNDVRVILDAMAPLPLARVESQVEADVLIAGLARLGLKCSILADSDMADDRLPVRLSNIELLKRGIAVTDFNTRAVTEINDLALIIPGLLTTNKVDSIEKKGRRGKTKVIDETATASDESILDLYSRHDPVGYRVHLTGFDFSCLGDDKGLIAVENMRRLVVVLKEHAPNARVVSDYKKVRQALGQVWNIESRKDPQGLKRSGFGKREFGTVASTSNLRQFTKYSRLQWHLL